MGFEVLLNLAGAATAGLLSKTTKPTVDGSLRAKVDTMKYLQKLTNLEDLKLSVLFSSQAAIIPMVGQGLYCAANNALEGFCNGSNKSLTISWGAFGDVGMYLQMNNKQREEEEKLWNFLESHNMAQYIEAAS